MLPAPDSADKSYCRAVLPRVSRTFAINIRLLGKDLRERVNAGLGTPLPVDKPDEADDTEMQQQQQQQQQGRPC